MKQLTEETIHRCSFQYDDENERREHIKKMVKHGWKVEEFYRQYDNHEHILPHATFEQEFHVNL